MYGYLMHYGVKGMQWGIRNYQNSDGSLTAAGRRRYGVNGKVRNSTKMLMSQRGINKTINQERRYAIKQIKSDVKHENYTKEQAKRAISAGKRSVEKCLDHRWGKDYMERNNRYNRGYKVANAIIGTYIGMNIAALGLKTAATVYDYYH